MHDSQGQQTTTRSLRRQRMRPLALLAIGPIALGLLVTGCTAVEDTTDYIGDLFSYVEDDDEIFGSDGVSADDSYRSLSEVPTETPAVSSTNERVQLTAGLVADREKAQHTAEELRARVDSEEAMTQVRAVYKLAEPAPTNGG